MRPLYYGAFAFARLFGGKTPGGSARQILPCTAPHQSSSPHAGRNVLRSGHMAAPFWRRVFGLENRQKQEERLCAPPQTVEKPLILGRAAFLAPFRRSQRSQEMLRHKALGLCPKPRQARREACALWALGPKAQSDPQRGSETMSATVREARMIEQPMIPLHPALCRQPEPCAARLPYTVSRPGALRRRARGKRRNPAKKIAAGELFRRDR